jgi:tRNA threonylcarbamoyladenosine biosynthesis protein TsaE
MKLQYHLHDINQTAQAILQTYPYARCFAFFAEMGSGKTTLIKALCKQLGVEENTSSPTFSIINEYRSADGNKIYHSDWYRLKGAQEAVEAGVEDILQEVQAYCFIEWPEIAIDLLPANCIRIQLTAIDEQTRLLQIAS